MSFDAQQLYELLPAIYRIRDEEASGAGRGVLRALVEVIADQVAVLENDIDQLYDDQFIETCADWVAPYIGDVVGYRTLYGLTDKIGSPRAEVADTIAFRRRKGTASMLEQLARDVTGWDARVVEFFQRLATTQYMNHTRPANVAWVDLRQSASLATIGTPFDVSNHTADVRSIAKRRGKHNIPNLGIYLWRLQDYRLTATPAVKLVPDPGDRRYLFHQTGANAPLFSHAVAEDTITHIATRENVPMPITRRELWDQPGTFYPASVSVTLGGRDVPVSAISACDLSDLGSGWAYDSPDTVLIDPVLGRLVVPEALTVDGRPFDVSHPVVTFHYGFQSDLGGGPYARVQTFSDDIDPVVGVTAPDSIAAALGGLSGSGVIEVHGNGRFEEAISIGAAAGVRIELRAAEGVRPALVLPSNLEITLADDAEVTLNGFLLAGGALRVLNGTGRGRLRLRHCTLIPGIRLKVDGTPDQPGAPSLLVESGSVAVEIDHCILGGVRADANATVTITNSIVDANDATAVAYSAADGIGPGGEVQIITSTLIGKVHARILRLVSNSILEARLAESDAWTVPVQAERRQEGCARFSYLPLSSRTPRRHRCVPALPADAARMRPQFTAERYGDPAYLQLSARTPLEIRDGADDESEMGAYHEVFGPQRETNLQIRLDEYLRFGLEAGIFYST
jgi:hypothetical protein